MLGASGAGFNAISRKFDINVHAVRRHMNNHVSAERRAMLIAGPLKLHQLAERAAEEGMALSDYVSVLRSSLFQQYLTACEASDRNSAAMIAGRLVEVLHMQGQVNGDLVKIGAQITHNTLVMSSPLMGDLQQMLVTKLRPYPDAARAVFAGLQELSTRALQGPTPLLEASHG